MNKLAGRGICELGKVANVIGARERLVTDDTRAGDKTGLVRGMVFIKPKSERIQTFQCFCCFQIFNY